MSHLICLILCLVCVVGSIPSDVYSEILGDLHSELAVGTDFNSRGKRSNFSAYEKIKVYVTFKDLPVGSYKTDTQWVDPSGKVANHYSHEFTIESTRDYIYYSWLELMPLGPLESTLEGHDFAQHQIGTWTVIVYLNTKRLNSKEFTISEL